MYFSKVFFCFCTAFEGVTSQSRVSENADDIFGVKRNATTGHHDFGALIAALASLV